MMRGGRFAVLGGGLSGMTAAMLLARHGHTVTLIEKRKKLGPTLRGFSRQGVRFDTGLHYAGGLSPDGPLTRYFRLLGLEDVPLKEFNPHCFDRVRFTHADREIHLPVGYEATIDALCSSFPAERRFIRTYLEQLRKAFLSSAFLNFDGDWRSLMDERLNAESLDTVLRRGTRDPLLRETLSIHALLYGVSPVETPFLQHARIAGSYLDGVKTVSGGGRALALALERRLAEAGVTSLCGVAAVRLEASATGVSGVLLDDERLIPVDGVVFTAHPVLLPPMLPPGAARPAFIKRLRSLEDTISAFSLFGAARTAIPLLQGSNLFICTEQGLDAGFRPDCRAENGPFYLSGSTEGNDASSGFSHGFIAFAPGNANLFADWKDSRSGKRPAAYYEFKTEKLASVWETITRFCPELAAAAILDGGTPLTNRDSLASPGCGLYGTKHSLNQFSPLPVTRIPNLWLAGQSVIAPGVLGAIISGIMACGFILGMDVIHKEVAACA